MLCFLTYILSILNLPVLILWFKPTQGQEYEANPWAGFPVQQKSRNRYPELRLVLRQDGLVQCFQDDVPSHNSIPHGLWEREQDFLTVTFHYGCIDSKARPHVFSRLKHTDVWQQEESHGGAMLIPWQPEQEDLIND
jgi:hypothetical protein